MTEADGLGVQGERDGMSELVIWKVDLYSMPAYTTMPKGAVIMDVQLREGRPVAWIAVDPKAPKAARRIRAVETGDAWPEGGVYMTTTQSGQGYVQHWFDEGEA